MTEGSEEGESRPAGSPVGVESGERKQERATLSCHLAVHSVPPPLVPKP
jgi:hypothetical protein